MVNEWLNAALSDDTPVTAELRQMFKQLRDDYGKRSDTELDFRTSVLARRCLRAGAQNRSPGAGERSNLSGTRRRSSRKDTLVSKSGAKGNRTPDLLDANESRYQLRHSPAVASRLPARSGEGSY